MSARRLLIVQYGGDYREAYERLSSGGDENYHGQRYSVDAVAGFLGSVDAAATLCAMTAQPYDEVLANGVRAVGAGFDGELDPTALIGLAERLEPTHVVLRTAFPELVRWAAGRGGRTIATFAEALPEPRPRRLVRALNGRGLEWVGCYRLESAEQYAQLGVSARKIIPWQWPDKPGADAYGTRALRTGGVPWRLVYVGALDERKGLGDALAAVARLAADGHDATLTVAGAGDEAAFRSLADALGVAARVRFAGVVASSDVVALMRDADAVLVPSRPDYPEAFPLVVDHALRARTPIVASDHPQIVRRLEHRVNAMVFGAGDAGGLAACVEELMTEGALYERLSAAAEDTLRALQVGLEWAELIEAWLADTPAERRRLAAHALASPPALARA